MSLSTHTIKGAKGSSKKRKRIGRGNASGTGTYSGKGLKGQNCRSGVSNLKRLGMKQVLLRTPKKRGFNSVKSKKQVVNLSDLNKHFKEGEIVSKESLLKKALVDNIKVNVKILAKGELTVKNLKFKDVLMSEAAKKQLKVK
ncbi:MAG: 50S ribosomal protein L15 [Patescibacteria group bacterium]|nr:50S ribosomal protein L15 [Patescibacteria group bacterium]